MCVQRPDERKATTDFYGSGRMACGSVKDARELPYTTGVHNVQPQEGAILASASGRVFPRSRGEAPAS